MIAGGGEQAAQKARVLMKMGVKVILHADSLDEEAQGSLLNGSRQSPGGSPGIPSAVRRGSPSPPARREPMRCSTRWGKETGATVIVVDRPDLSK